MDFNRIKHSLGVARKMVELGRLRGLSDDELENCFAIGYNHDIGYEFDPLNHEHVGGLLLKNNGFQFWEEVYNHGDPDTYFSSVYFDILIEADMSINSIGNEVSFDERLEDIGSRLGYESLNYLNSKKMINKIIQNKNSQK